MLLKWIMHRIKLFFLCIINAIRRSLCCFRRKKYPAESDVLTDVVTSSTHVKKREEDVNWNVNWDMDGNRIPSSVQDHIEIYREKKAKQSVTQVDTGGNTDLNFFQDMTPKIIPQKKIILNSNSSNNGKSRLDCTDHSFVPVVQSELTEWEDTDGMHSWEEAADCDTEQAIREKRRADRKRRLAEQQRKKQEKEMIKMSTRQTLAAKMS